VPGVIAEVPEPQPVQGTPPPKPVGGGGALPFTGSSLPLGLASLVALAMIGLGSLMLAARRRRVR
jgi:hypothetical protein